MVSDEENICMTADKKHETCVSHFYFGMVWRRFVRLVCMTSVSWILFYLISLPSEGLT